MGVAKTATSSEIRKAYYQLAKQLHPDKNPEPSAKEKFQEVSKAYEILSDQTKRLLYDQTGMVDEDPRFSGNFDWDSYWRALYKV